MVIKSEQLADLQKKGLEAAAHLVQLSIENSQRVVEIQVATAKALFTDSVNSAKALSSVKDVQQAVEVRTRYAQDTAEKVLNAAREITEVAAQTQAEVGKLVGEQLTSSGAEVLNTFQKLFKGLPVVDQGAFNVFQNAVENTRVAFEQAARASTEAFQNFSNAATTTIAAPAKGRK
jgi:phasin family protein